MNIVTLEDIAAPIKNAIVDGPFGSNLKTSDYVDNGVPVLQGKNITGNKFRWFDVRYITDEKAEELKRSSVRVGDILIIKIGSIGYSAIIDDLKEHDFAIIPANLAKLTINKHIVDAKYVIYYLSSSIVAKKLLSLSSKTAQPALSLEKIKKFPIPLPPLPIQKRIAEILEKTDAVREKRRLTLALTEQFLQSAFLDMFGDPVTNPKGWEKILVKTAGTIVTGTTPSSNYKGMFGGDIPFITPGDLESNEECKRFVTKEGADNSRMVRKGTTFVCCIGATIGKVGRASVMSAFNQQINAIEWNHEFTDLFGEMLMRFMKPVIIQKGGNSTTLPILNKGNFERLEIIKPPLSLQQQFAALVEKVEVMRVKQRESERELESLFQSLMQRAFGQAQGGLFEGELVS